MATVYLKTPQNVTIEVGLASSLERAVAYFIDFIVIIAWISLIGTLMGILLQDSDWFVYVYFLLVVPFFVFYHLALEILWQGQSIGKKIMRLKVVKFNGDLPSADDFLLRWAFRMIDVSFSFTALAATLILTSENKQRLGDVLAGTLVVKLQPEGNQHKGRVFKEENKEQEREFLYPNLIAFNDQEMMLIKNLLARYYKNPSPTHQTLLKEAAQTIAQKLKLSKVPQEPVRFLEAVLEEYVFMTR
ncbi:RDD family protein [Hugenholtzia roseola]|uniref:RDD family protein n=1 Tax=Hugenholtzia roseola TaxID=1002 RepID=UPI00042858B3|nr:RDD family protein [Hugenholtzia roseola]